MFQGRYIRFEHATTGSNIDAGEQVRWLPRRRAADLLLPGCDCWVFDGRRVLFNPKYELRPLGRE